MFTSFFIVFDFFHTAKSILDFSVRRNYVISFAMTMKYAFSFNFQKVIISKLINFNYNLNPCETTQKAFPNYLYQSNCRRLNIIIDKLIA